MINLLKKIFYQPRRSFPTTDPIAYHLKSSLLARAAGIKPFSSLMYVIPQLRNKFTKLDINERIIEMPFIFNNISKNRKSKILDVGCCETILPIQLASLGYNVTGIDIRPYELKHPNFNFIKTDICNTTNLKEKFDFITCISALEHIGLDTIYGKTKQHSSDKKAINSMFNLLKPKGQLLLTVPIASKFSQSGFMKIYTPKKLHQLLKSFDVIKEDYFCHDGNRVNWQPSSSKDLPHSTNFGVATIIAQKPTQSRK